MSESGTNSVEGVNMVEVYPHPKPPKRWVSEKHCNEVRQMRCCVCFKAPPNEVHHMLGIEKRGMGTRVSDYLTVSLCLDCHDSVHNKGVPAECYAEAARNLAKLFRGAI